MRKKAKIPILPISSRVEKFLQGETVFIHPDYDPEFFYHSLDFLVLIFDGAIIKHPSPSDFLDLSLRPTWKKQKTSYPSQRFLDLVEGGLVIPLCYGPETPEWWWGSDPLFKRILNGEIIWRPSLYKDIYPEISDARTFSRKIDRKGFVDLSDEWCNLVTQLPVTAPWKGAHPRIPMKAQKALALYSFANWMTADILESYLLDASLFCNQEYRKLWEYRLRDFWKKVISKGEKKYAPEKNTPHQIYPLLREFSKGIQLEYPIDLPIDEIKTFKKQKACINFRKWFFDVISKAGPETVETIPNIVTEFNELAYSVTLEKNKERKKITMKIDLILLLLSLASAPADLRISIPLAILTFLIDKVVTPKILEDRWRKTDPYNWIIFFGDWKVPLRDY